MIAGRSRILLATFAIGCLITASAASADVARLTPPAGPLEAPQGAAVNWIDHFDTYATGINLHGVGGWEGWGNSAGAGAATSGAQFRSAPNSVEIAGPSDLVHPHTGYTSDTWVYTAWQFVPTGSSGQTYFIMLNTYSNDAGCTGCNWSVQVNMDTATGAIVNEGATIGTGTLVYDTWVPIVVIINLTANTQSFFYNNLLLYTGTWTEEVSGGGALNFATVDLFANGATSVFYDDLSLSNLPFVDGFESESTNEWHFTTPAP
jgi:hypothetical protein